MGRLRVAAGCWLLPAACSKVVAVSLREAEMWVGELAAIERLRSEWVGADNVQNSTDSAQETGCEERAEGGGGERQRDGHLDCNRSGQVKNSDLRRGPPLNQAARAITRKA